VHPSKPENLTRKRGGWKAAKASALARQQKALGKLPTESAPPAPAGSSQVFVRQKVIEPQRASGSLWVRWRASHGYFWSDSERALFFRQLSTFCAAGITLDRAILHLAGSAFREPLRLRLKQISLQIQRGQSFPSALGASGLFTGLHLGMIGAGDAAGKLSETLASLAASEETLCNYRGRLKGQLMYPACVTMCVWIAAPLFLVGLARIIAVVQENLSSASGATDPWVNLITHPAVPMAAFLFPPLLLIVYFWLTRTGRLRASQLPLGVGALVAAEEFVWIGRVLAQLLQAGLRLPRCLELLTELGVGPDLTETRKQIEEGKSLAESLPKSFPPLFLLMVAVGEECGSIPELLNRACDLLDSSLELKKQAWLVMVEPILLAVLGLLAGLTVLLCSGPLTQLVQSLT